MFIGFRKEAVLQIQLKRWMHLPWLVGSVGWASSSKAKDCRFDSQSGHMPGLWVWFPDGACVRGNRSMFFFRVLSLPLFSFPSPLSKNQYLFLKIFFLIFRERGTSMCGRYIDLLPLACPPLGTRPKPRHVPWLRIRPVTFGVHRLALNPLSHTSRSNIFFKNVF